MEGPRLSIRIEASRRLFAASMLLHVAAIAAPWGAALPAWLRLALSLAAGLGLVATWRRYRLDRSRGPWRLQVDDGRWSLGRGVELEPVEVLGDTTVWEWLVVLRVRGPDAHARSLAVLPDSCTADEMRRLRVALRMSARGISRVDRA